MTRTEIWSSVCLVLAEMPFETPPLAAAQNERHLMVRRPRAVSNHEIGVSN